MPGKLFNTKFLITSSLVTSKQKTTTSLSRQSDDLFTTRSLLLVILVLFSFFAFIAHGTALRRNKAMNKVETIESTRNLIYFGDSVSDSDITSLQTASKTVKSTTEANFYNSDKFLRSLCHRLSYQICLKLRQLAKQWVKRKFLRYQPSTILPLFEHDKLSADTTSFPTTTKDDKSLSSQLNKSEYDTIRTRQKRLASGDRRVVHLYCRTNFVLEIQDDGSVVGNPIKTDKAALEIQTVARDGVVRFYSPATNYFLAMDDRGRLYGTKTYSEEHCAFVERVQANLWSTYSTNILPNKKTRRHRNKRSASRAWYVAIGKSGKPRKASRIRPSQSSAQFLPRPFS